MAQPTGGSCSHACGVCLAISVRLGLVAIVLSSLHVCMCVVWVRLQSTCDITYRDSCHILTDLGDNYVTGLLVNCVRILSCVWKGYD